MRSTRSKRRDLGKLRVAVLSVLSVLSLQAASNVSKQVVGGSVGNNTTPRLAVQQKYPRAVGGAACRGEVRDLLQPRQLPGKLFRLAAVLLESRVF
jgi:hypothetical protein